MEDEERNNKSNDNFEDLMTDYHNLQAMNLVNRNAFIAKLAEAIRMSVKEQRMQEVKQKNMDEERVKKLIRNAILTVAAVGVISTSSFNFGKNSLAQDIVEAKATTPTGYIDTYNGTYTNANGESESGYVYAYNSDVFLNSIVNTLGKSSIDLRTKLWSIINDILPLYREDEVSKMLQGLHGWESIDFYLNDDSYSFLRATSFEELCSLLGYESTDDYIKNEMDTLQKIVVDSKGKSL